MDEAEYCDRLGLIYRGELVALGSPRELKSQRLTDPVLDLRCDRPQDAMAVVEGVDGVGEAALFGAGLHVLCADPPSVMPRLHAALAAAGYRVDRMEVVPPSLEDVFVALIEARDRAGEPQREVRR